MGLPGPQRHNLERLRRDAVIPAPVPRHLGPLLVQPSQPGALSPEQGTYVRLPGANYPPAGAIPVLEPGDGNIAPGASAIVVSIVVPDTYRFRMSAIGFGADDETALPFLNWSVRFGTDTQPGYTNKPAALGTLQFPAPVFLVAGSSVTVNLVVEATAAAVLTYRYIGVIHGWFWREDAI